MNNYLKITKGNSLITETNVYLSTLSCKNLFFLDIVQNKRLYSYYLNYKDTFLSFDNIYEIKIRVKCIGTFYIFLDKNTNNLGIFDNLFELSELNSDQKIVQLCEKIKVINPFFVIFIGFHFGKNINKYLQFFITNKIFMLVADKRVNDEDHYIKCGIIKLFKGNIYRWVLMFFSSVIVSSNTFFSITYLLLNNLLLFSIFLSTVIFASGGLLFSFYDCLTRKNDNIERSFILPTYILLISNMVGIGLFVLIFTMAILSNYDISSFFVIVLGLLFVIAMHFVAIIIPVIFAKKKKTNRVE